jgi:hypothetical protein
MWTVNIVRNTAEAFRNIVDATWLVDFQETAPPGLSLRPTNLDNVVLSIDVMRTFTIPYQPAGECET